MLKILKKTISTQHRPYSPGSALTRLTGVIATLLVMLCLSTYAKNLGNPLWTLTPIPGYSPTVSVSAVGSANIQYTVTNQSEKTHTLMMQAITGITQISTSSQDCTNPFTLTHQQSCILNLQVQGNDLTGAIQGGPVVCQTGSMLQCYQPAIAERLNISLVPISYYVITPLPCVDGSIMPDTAQTVVENSSLTFTATPDSGYQVDEWLVDGDVAQKGGLSFTLSQIKANHTVDATFTRQGTLFVSTASGLIYYSMDNGGQWAASTAPAPGISVNSVFATLTTLYAGSANGFVYYSNNNGTTWTATSIVSGGSPVNSVFVTGTTIYAGTENGSVWYSTNNGVSWTSIGTPSPGFAVNSLFITPTTSIIYVGNADGNAYYSINNGTTWISMTGPTPTVPIQNIFVTDSTLYVNTRQLSTNSTLPASTVNFEYTYFTNDLNHANPTWTLLSQITYTLFVNADASIIYAGTQDGYIYSLITGNELGFITYSPITGIYFIG